MVFDSEFHSQNAPLPSLGRCLEYRPCLCRVLMGEGFYHGQNSSDKIRVNCHISRLKKICRRVFCSRHLWDTYLLGRTEDFQNPRGSTMEFPGVRDINRLAPH
ncbi:hypothetical protein GDO81_018302 [Engystomops pustulosus]|uniref:Uncharacterized protein n=1 Tax=Engystomops pustulosus TaxID=76066 RepID=A0AAV7AAW7_ENGPU|nr:hypothetical protein GDO81_018302 [Engystomops pustulosus]